VLHYSVFVSEIRPIVIADLPPNTTQRTWSPISATLIYGERDAVLVDPLMTIEDGRALAEWVAGTGKNLIAIYSTHGHGDHFFGAAVVRRRFPSARFLATPAVIRKMRQQASPESLESFWKPLLPNQIPSDLSIAEPLAGGAIELEGEDVVVVPLGHTDTDDTTCLHVPSIGLVVAGDAAYNDVHLHLGESNPLLRGEWIAALDTIESLRPRAVIAGHKRRERDDDPRILEETRQYIRDFNRITESAKTALDLYTRMLALYADRVNPGALWASARALKH
jgi:glyoxylase-like metal-dependent hydrolase (beta-lactamase superfamily II)